MNLNHLVGIGWLEKREFALTGSGLMMVLLGWVSCLEG